MNKLSQSEKKFFFKNGYIHIKSVIPKNKIKNFRETFCSLLSHYSNTKVDKNFDDPNMVKILKKLRKKSSKNFFYFFRTLSLTSNFNNLFNDKKLQEICSEILKMKGKDLIIAEPQLRVDEPKNEKFSLDWHQDVSHYNQDPSGKNSLVLNLIVQNHTKEMGTPLIKIGSHKSGVQKFTEKKKIKKSKVSQLIPNKKYLNKNFNVTYVNSKPGDIVIYDMRLLHKSGLNISDKIRVSVISRAFNPRSPYFKSFRYLTKIF